MSKRHQATRRRVYGRRLHELNQRPDRRADRARVDLDWSSQFEGLEVDPLAFLDPRSLRARFDFGE